MQLKPGCFAALQMPRISCHFDLSTTVSAEELLAPGYVELGFAPLLATFVLGVD